jgi:hypothetical protein
VEMDGPIKDESDQLLRLVSLVYKLLWDMKMPVGGETDAEVLLRLSRAFADKATALGEGEAVEPKEREGKPTFMFSTDSVGMRTRLRDDH